MKDCDGEFGTGTDMPQVQSRNQAQTRHRHNVATWKKERKQK